MTVRIYKSTDSSAPTWSGTAGDSTTVFDAVLVNGYGSQTAAGWTIEYTTTNKRVYRAPSGRRLYLDVNDAAPVTAKESQMRGYETMSAIATGTGPYPTTAQQANGIFLRKSTTADATTRPWIIAADGRTLYTFIKSADNANMYTCFMFGDIYSYGGSADAYASMIIGRSTENSASTTNAFEVMDSLVQIASTVSGHFIARDTVPNVGSVACGKMGDWALNNNGAVLNGSVAYKNVADGDIQITPLRICHQTPGNIIRGHLRGLWHFQHAISNAADGDTFSGVGANLTGKTFLVIKTASTSGGIYILETSDTWDTN